MVQLSSPSSVTPLELPRGLALNRFRLTCPGIHRVTRLPRPADREERRVLERSIGQSVFQKGDFCYTSPEISAPDSSAVDLECDFDRRLHLFDLRACISEQAAHEKLRVRFGFAGELQITGFAGDAEIDGLRVERRLRLRVVDGDSGSSDSWVVGRHDSRYLVSGTLIDSEVRRRAVGEMAERLAGSGPARGEVLSVSDKQVVLLVGDEEIAVEPSVYTLTVRSAYVTRYHHADTLARLQVASGSLTQSGRRNRYAVKDRYEALIHCVEQLGWVIAMPADRQAIIERSWTEIRIQAGNS